MRTERDVTEQGDDFKRIERQLAKLENSPTLTLTEKTDSMVKLFHAKADLINAESYKEYLNGFNR